MHEVCIPEDESLMGAARLKPFAVTNYLTDSQERNHNLMKMNKHNQNSLPLDQFPSVKLELGAVWRHYWRPVQRSTYFRRAWASSC